MNLSDYVRIIRNHLDFGPAFIHHRYIPPNVPEYGPESEMPDEIKQVLSRTGIHHFYRHQTEAMAHIRRGENVIIATPTASGKSMIYNLAVLETLLRNKKPRPYISSRSRPWSRTSSRPFPCF